MFIIIPAAGFGKRMNIPIAKQFIEVSGKTILEHTANKIIKWANTYNHEIDIIIVLSAGVVLPFQNKLVSTCKGGLLRADSVQNAINFIKNSERFKSKLNIELDSWVMVHDAARPMVCIDDIENLYQSIRNDIVGGILATKINSTVKKVNNNFIEKTINREQLYLALTPQIFKLGILKKSLVTFDKQLLTDESSGIEMLGLKPKIVIGKSSNIKITTKEDLVLFDSLL